MFCFLHCSLYIEKTMSCWTKCFEYKSDYLEKCWYYGGSRDTVFFEKCIPNNFWLTYTFILYNMCVTTLVCVTPLSWLQVVIPKHVCFGFWGLHDLWNAMSHPSWHFWRFPCLQGYNFTTKGILLVRSHGSVIIRIELRGMLLYSPTCILHRKCWKMANVKSFWFIYFLLASKNNPICKLTWWLYKVRYDAVYYCDVVGYSSSDVTSGAF
jgi:hypothetical protein